MIDVSSKVKDSHYIYVDEVYSWFKNYFPVQIALFIACQFALESAYGTSSIARLNNNHCGMKEPRVRLNLSVGVNRGFACFRSVYDNRVDYLLWLAWNRFLPKHYSNVFQFKTKLRSCGYCPDADYLDRIQKLYDQYAPLLFNQIVY